MKNIKVITDIMLLLLLYVKSLSLSIDYVKISVNPQIITEHYSRYLHLNSQEFHTTFY